jgi:hypothetical protein
MLVNVSIIRLSVVLFFVVSFASCDTRPATRKEFHSFADGIMVESYVEGNLRTKQYFTKKDTIPNGPRLQYSLNGQIEQWIWYKNGEESFRADYKNDLPIELTGNPFLYAEEQQGKKQLIVQMIYPPNASVITRLYTQSNNSKGLAYTEYPVVVFDSTCHIILGEHDSFINDPQHNYILAYFFVDSEKNTIRTADVIMEIVPPKYTFTKVDKQTMPLRDSGAVKVYR